MKNIFPIFSLAIIFFFCCFILLRFSVKNFLIDNGVENKFTDKNNGKRCRQVH
ncbi:MAG: hypothetical protein FWB90_08375 [Fibromonadales bacterium]|nr:hypothetical protein [Fibromonadales bacterium]